MKWFVNTRKWYFYNGKLCPTPKHILFLLLQVVYLWQTLSQGIRYIYFLFMVRQTCTPQTMVNFCLMFAFVCVCLIVFHLRLKLQPLVFVLACLFSASILPLLHIAQGVWYQTHLLRQVLTFLFSIWKNWFPYKWDKGVWLCVCVW